jgi:biopolymer transport protein ExbD
MGASLGGGDDGAIVDINITPFVDIVLVVLIIFMVTATTIVKQSIKVELPEAATGEGSNDESLAVRVDAGGQFTLNGEPATLETIRAALREARRKSDQDGSKPTLLIGADKAVPYGEVVKLIDLSRQEGVVRYMLNIDPAALPAEASGALPAPASP